jgi:hypothetical protein
MPYGGRGSKEDANHKNKTKMGFTTTRPVQGEGTMRGTSLEVVIRLQQIVLTCFAPLCEGNLA